MNKYAQYILIIAGIIAVVYITFRYIIPLLFKLIGFIIGFLAYGAAVVLAVAIVLIIIGYIVRIYKTHSR
jgi:hypothetical protein